MQELEKDSHNDKWAIIQDYLTSICVLNNIVSKYKKKLDGTKKRLEKLNV